ncbi:hypothetical protein EJ05DRAFT_486094 [Pseudovirgaria hyperparasitica]|uniref:Uncharacterized protein n=1 Tax=Pseudovirgaria hyperparasitica TaxID=470096 RepID=A0A6A6W7U9_9PEZI|nr:uncharacterized protein EJ05DRAFT_486094 [Pseudovirgaria hyperparasitica]KAF2758030.1 hypothetical protein EJ05DRAFT_486094 [Pseudovirgaria hyperparasitica]
MKGQSYLQQFTEKIVGEIASRFGAESVSIRSVGGNGMAVSAHTHVDSENTKIIGPEDQEHPFRWNNPQFWLLNKKQWKVHFPETLGTNLEPTLICLQNSGYQFRRSGNQNSKNTLDETRTLYTRGNENPLGYTIGCVPPLRKPEYPAAPICFHRGHGDPTSHVLRESRRVV